MNHQPIENNNTGLGGGLMMEVYGNEMGLDIGDYQLSAHQNFQNQNENHDLSIQDMVKDPMFKEE
eukprot:CAMPEP_0170549050 /NCGR_PEP_ID=MMETSP0211-20121228/7233_1 /TAXON_ID=311385 /ORGANISM="Pseudokeronopsis sp., Strain OXSARD2" /LENGTH=64 /DNA_ID=CAMNT_0010854843 /DNA_START=872 /DNA_END=1066 /DNA_ORIENTATION=+